MPAEVGRLEKRPGVHRFKAEDLEVAFKEGFREFRRSKNIVRQSSLLRARNACGDSKGRRFKGISTGARRSTFSPNNEELRVASGLGESSRGETD